MPAFAVTEKNFKKEIKRCKTPVLLSFWADCGVSSVLMRQTADSLSDELNGKIKVGVIELQSESEKPKTHKHKLAQKYNVRFLPATLLINNGKVCERIIGNPGKDGFLKILNIS
ncbi:MAG: thioredoxin [Oscillospiraceae bacterium]|nr:thioredoxin [Oscillospiraceae bacterium]